MCLLAHPPTHAHTHPHRHIEHFIEQTLVPKVVPLQQNHSYFSHILCDLSAY